MENREEVSNADSDPIRDAWESLGIAFAANQTGMKHADPERTLLLTLHEFQDQRKMLKLLLAWLKEYGDLVHVERLKSLAVDITAHELAWLGGLSSHRVEDGDLRWKSIIQMIKERLGSPSPHFTTSKLDELQAKRVGIDKHFQQFGLILPLVEPTDAKKLTPFSITVQNNLWLRLRALFGTNWRADTATILVLGKAKNPYQAERILGCAKETAYRNWKALKEAGAETLLKGAA